MVEKRRIELPWSARETRLPFVRHKAARRRAFVSTRTLAVATPMLLHCKIQ
jgi:hypothetical protein